MKTELKQYIQNWKQIDGVKPANEPVFIDGFIWLLNNIDDDREIDFHGEGSYFGKEIAINIDSWYGKGDRDLSFEIAYSGEQITVYDANHNGFWHPPYLEVKKGHERFDDVRCALINRLTKVFGL